MHSTTNQTRQLALAAIIAALYATLTMALAPLSYGPVQLRISEGLTVLPFLFPAATPGLFIGCLIANLMSAYGPIDVVFGSLATLLAAYLTMRCPSKWLAPMPPVLCNAAIIGAVIAYAEVGFTEAFVPALIYNGISVGIGQFAACYGLGLIILTAIPRLPFFRNWMDEKQTVQRI